MRRKFVDWVIGRFEAGKNVPALIFVLVILCPVTPEQRARIKAMNERGATCSS